MPKTRGGLFSLDAHGSLGKTVTFVKRPQGTVAISIPTHPDARTLPQCYQRWRFIDAKYYWRSLTEVQRQAYETDARPYHMTGWAYYLRAYLLAPPDLVLHLKLDEYGATPVIDSSPAGNDGTVYGATPVPAFIANGRLFDGNDDYIDCGQDPDLDFGTGDLTFLARIKTQAEGTRRFIFTKDDGLGTNGIAMAMHIDRRFRVFLGNSGNLYSTTLLDDNTFHLVGGRRRSGTVSVLVNGVNETSGAGAGDVDVARPLLYGCYVNAVGVKEDWFKDTLDELRFYNRALTDEHIKQISDDETYP